MAQGRPLAFGLVPLLVGAATAHAHPVALDPVPVPSTHRDDPDRRLCAAETAMPIALVSLGVLDGGHTGRAMVLGGVATSFVAPSAGEISDGRAFSLGVGVRALGVTMMAYDSDNRGDSLFLGGTALTLAGALYEVATSRETLRPWNRDHGARIQLTPAAVPVRRGVGFGLFGRF
jgi:hypothetical protein